MVTPARVCVASIQNRSLADVLSVDGVFAISGALLSC